MAQKDDNLPEYLKNVPIPSEDQLWDDIIERFHELSDLLGSLRLETKEQAIPQRHGMRTVDGGIFWDDSEVGIKVRSWLQIPYDQDRDIDDFEVVRETALVLAEKLAARINRRKLDAETLNDWGRFCQYASIVEYEWLRQRPNTRALKGGPKQSRDQHKFWYSHLYLHLRQQGDTRRDTEGRLLDYLNDILEKDQFPDPVFPKEWFEQFLGGTGEDLAASFKQNKLTITEMKRRAEQPLDGLPPLEW